MGMELTAHWKCERCEDVADVKIGAIPEGWKYAAQADLWVDAQDFTVDFKLPNVKTIICNKCVDSYIRWVTYSKSDANIVKEDQADSSTPVDSSSESPVVSGRENDRFAQNKSLAEVHSIEDNRTVTMEDIVSGEELPERNCERDFPHDGHPFIDDSGKEFGCPGIKNGPNLESDLV